MNLIIFISVLKESETIIKALNLLKTNEVVKEHFYHLCESKCIKFYLNCSHEARCSLRLKDCMLIIL